MAKNYNFQEETDVIVIGYGGAGAAAAIAAHDAGAKVIILEKQPCDTAVKTMHTPSTRMCGGGWFSPKDPDLAAQYLEGLARKANESVDDERKRIISTFANYLYSTTEWMNSIGIEANEAGLLAEFPELPGANTCGLYQAKNEGLYRNGAALFKGLSSAVTDRNIPVMWKTPAIHLISDDGEIRGVIVRNEQREFGIKASKAVILSCGGFEFNEWMKQNYLRVYPAYFYGNPGSTGDGINMVMEVGAAMWHMNAASWRVTYKFPEYPVAFGTQNHETGTIIVDKRGHRFANERFKMHTFGYELTNYDSYAVCYPKVPSYLVFDEKRRKMGPLASFHGVCNPPGGIMGDIHYIWDEDNSKEIDRGWILKASTIDELALKIKADPDNNELMKSSILTETIKRYNRYCQNGADLEFNKPSKFLLPVEDPPYYAIKLWPGGPNTQGGPKRNERAQVLRIDNTPLHRLYVAGELGSVWGMLYQVGGNIGECIAFGRIAGTNAAMEKSWK